MEDRAAGGAPLPSRRHLVVWTFASQAVSSLTNFGFTVLLARSVGVEEFGAFGIAFAVFSFVIGIVRAGVTTPLLVAHSAGDPEARRVASLESAGASVAAGLLATVLGLVSALVAPEPLGSALLALGLALPCLLLQDAWRQAFFTAGRPRDAAVGDVLWAAGVFAIAGVLHLTGSAGVFSLICAWGAGALLASTWGWRRVGGLPRVRSALAWMRTHTSQGGRLSLEFLLNMGAINLATFILGAIAGLAATGALRAAQTLLGPMQTFFSALSSFALPVAARQVAAGDQRGMVRFCTTLSALCMAAAAIVTGVLLALPPAVGEALLGETWDSARGVVLPAGALLVAVGLSMGPSICLKGLSRADLLLTASYVQGPLMLVCGAAGAWAGGAVGGAWGFFAAQVVGSSLSVYMVARALRASAAARTPSTLPA
ncbi:oligosaccharide flippase family protein [Quadrisphaera sp. KR29]|uniref:oligosaccharide flippase family protein n=1 Tax=Quadrisphaera sp. KR29 TaxID=3461391 RepID=UPI0040450BA2